jgi:type IV fimbrial biogenesis protein FimT
MNFLQEMHPMRKNAGFTLAELMVVLAIIAIVSAIALPNMLTWRQKHRVGSAARDILSAIEIARSEAVRDDEVVTVTLNFGNDSFTVIDQDGNTIRNVRLASDMDLRNGDIDAANGLGAQVRFTGRGLPDVDGEITVMRRNATAYSRCIRVTIGGNARIYKPDEAI